MVKPLTETQSFELSQMVESDLCLENEIAQKAHGNVLGKRYQNIILHKCHLT